jgi:RNA polymerase sigma factor (sigma-70 family)
MVSTTTEQLTMTQSEFLNVVMPFKDKLYRLAKRLLVSSEEAEDATQEILMKLWAKNKMIESYKNVEAFAMTMTKNFCLDRLKSKQSNNLKLVHSNYADGSASLQRQVESKDSVSWVEKIMQDLPEQQKMVLQLRDIEEYDFDEIAELLEMQPTAVRVTLSRARKTVREKLLQKHSYGIG